MKARASAAGTASHTPSMSSSIGSMSIDATRNTSARKNEMTADTRPSEKAVNMPEA